MARLKKLANKFDKLSKLGYLYNMIKTEKNENILGFFNVFAFGKLVREVQGRVKAKAFANELAKEHKQTHFMHKENAVKVS